MQIAPVHFTDAEKRKRKKKAEKGGVRAAIDAERKRLAATQDDKLKKRDRSDTMAMRLQPAR